MNRPVLVRCALGVAVAVAAPLATAQSWPSRPIRVIVPFPAGGGIDTVARIIAPKMAESLGQPLVIENRVGAGGTVGTEVVARASADGHTLLGAFASHAMNATLYRDLSYDTERAFAPISLIATVPNILVVHPSLPVKTVSDLIALARRRPGDINYASVGSGTPAHLSAELFNLMAGVKMTHVPYKGAPASIIGMITGEAQLTFTTVLIAMPHVKSGKLRAVAVTTPRALVLATRCTHRERVRPQGLRVGRVVRPARARGHPRAGHRAPACRGGALDADAGGAREPAAPGHRYRGQHAGALRPGDPRGHRHLDPGGEGRGHQGRLRPCSARPHGNRVAEE